MLLHAKWSNFDITQRTSIKFSGMLGMLGGNEKNDPRNFKQRPGNLKKGYSQDLVKQTAKLRCASW